MKIYTRHASSADNAAFPRAFLYCAEGEKPAVIEKIKSDLLLLTDCRIYTGSTTAIQEDDRLFLRQMHLVVLPITRTLLRKDSAALKLIAFAQAERIPLLPLLMETGVEAEFNRKVGHLHMLDACSSDPTARDYYDKLSSLLEAILLSDETRKHIWDAFPVKLMLSYRKSDRALANQLMSHIHSVYRDVGIWYDEFLTIGEDYDENIERTIEDSDAIVFLITRNLLRHGNYVLEKEYPYACASNKRMLGYVVRPEDESKAAKAFPRVSAYADEAALCGKLQAELSAALLEERNDAEHLYYIGLAYQFGVGAEIDRKKGTKLLTEAAILGEGNAQNYLKRLYHADMDSLADEYFFKALALERKMKQPSSDPAETFCGYYELGQIYQNLTTPYDAPTYVVDAAEIKAKEAFENALKNCEGMKSATHLRQACECCYALYILASDLPQRIAAVQTFEKNADRLLETDITSADANWLALTYVSIADDFPGEEGMALAEKAEKAAERIAGYSQQNARLLFKIYERLAVRYRLAGNPELAVEYYRKCCTVGVHANDCFIERYGLLHLLEWYTSAGNEEAAAKIVSRLKALIESDVMNE